MLKIKNIYSQFETFLIAAQTQDAMRKGRAVGQYDGVPWLTHLVRSSFIEELFCDDATDILFLRQSGVLPIILRCTRMHADSGAACGG